MSAEKKSCKKSKIMNTICFSLIMCTDKSCIMRPGTSESKQDYFDFMLSLKTLHTLRGYIHISYAIECLGSQCIPVRGGVHLSSPLPQKTINTDYYWAPKCPLPVKHHYLYWKTRGKKRWESTQDRYFQGTKRTLVYLK